MSKSSIEQKMSNLSYHSHWEERVRERISDSVCPKWLFFRLVGSISSDDGWAVRKMRQSGKRFIYYFHLKGERYFAVVHKLGSEIVPITILLENFEVRSRKKRKLLSRDGRYQRGPKRKFRVGRR